MLLLIKSSETYETGSSEYEEDNDELSSNEKKIFSQFINYVQYYLNIHHFLNKIFLLLLYFCDFLITFLFKLFQLSHL